MNIQKEAKERVGAMLKGTVMAGADLERCAAWTIFAQEGLAE
jgi:hypothetical protein